MGKGESRRKKSDAQFSVQTRRSDLELPPFFYVHHEQSPREVRIAGLLRSKDTLTDYLYLRRWYQTSPILTHLSRHETVSLRRACWEKERWWSQVVSFTAIYLLRLDFYEAFVGLWSVGEWRKNWSIPPQSPCKSLKGKANKSWRCRTLVTTKRPTSTDRLLAQLMSCVQLHCPSLFPKKHRNITLYS